MLAGSAHDAMTCQAAGAGIISIEYGHRVPAITPTAPKHLQNFPRLCRLLASPWLYLDELTKSFSLARAPTQGKQRREKLGDERGVSVLCVKASSDKTMRRP